MGVIHGMGNCWFFLIVFWSQSCVSMEKKQNALLLAGAVSRLPKLGGERGAYNKDAGSLYDSSRYYSSIHVCAACIMKHIVAANDEVAMDIFLHTWSFDLKDQFKESYNLTASKFEDNRLIETKMKASYPYFPWTELSYTISVQRVVGLMLSHELKTGMQYDRVVLIRPDILMTKNLKLAALERGPNLMYCNSFRDGVGDFHFIMEHHHAQMISHAIPNKPTSKPYVIGNHGKMKQFAARVMNTTIKNDNQIFPGYDQEVYRKVPWELMLCNAYDWWKQYLTDRYGMNHQDWQQIKESYVVSAKRCVGSQRIMGYSCRKRSCEEDIRPKIIEQEMIVPPKIIEQAIAVRPNRNKKQHRKPKKKKNRGKKGKKMKLKKRPLSKKTGKHR